MNTLEKEFAPYEESVELKELGFDEPCLCFYNYKSQLIRYMNPDKDWNSLYSQTLKNSKITLPNTCSAPTFSQAFRWFREKHNLKSFIQPIPDDVDTYIFAYGTKEIEHDDEDYLKYEEAELACLRKLIEIVKEK